ncbi:MAG: Gfo/Idh/MocA family oxidoreductase [Planctomycetota bacterium]
MKQNIHVALVGLRFGAEFIPIYLHHPNVRALTIVDIDAQQVTKWSKAYGVQRTAASLEAILADPDIDAVHLVTPIPLHAQQSIQVLKSGRHCACTVPAATSLDDLHALVEAQHASGKVYMMMETAVYTREFLLAQEWLRRGDLGRIQLLRGAHYQDMEGWPEYWMGLPPMHYATHAVGPLLRLAGTHATHVHCFGSGTMRDELKQRYGNPYPTETAIMRLANSPVAAEVTRTLFETARDYTESFTVYGSAASFEWQQLEAEAPLKFAFTEQKTYWGSFAVGHERLTVPDRADLLPEAISRFTRRGVYDATNADRSFVHGGGHGGSHPHLVHEFVSAIHTGRPSSIDAATAAEWTAVGICAHQSAMADGNRVDVPMFR